MLCMIFVIGGGSVALAAEEEQETIVLANGSFANDQIVWEGTSCTITQSKGNSTTSPNLDYIAAPRWYKNNVISFSAKENYTLSSVTVVATSNAYAKELKNSTYSDGASASLPSSSSTVTITTNGDFTITMGAQSRISSITVTYIKGTSPTLNPSESSLGFGNVETGSDKNLTFKLTGSNLTSDAVLSITGDNADMFSVSPSSVSPKDGTISENDITVNYKPTSTGDHTATLNITSGEDASATVALSGTGIAPLAHYTVSWKVNGADYNEGIPSTDVIEGSKVTSLPKDPSSISGKVFVGWTNAEIVSSQNEKPSVLFTSAEESPIVKNNTIYYAVFAKQDGEGISSEELTGTEILNLGTLDYDTEKTYSSSSLKYVIHGYKNNEKYPWIQLKRDMGSYIKITAPQNITKVDFTITSTTNSKGGITDISKHNPFAGTVGLVTSDCEFSETSENIGSTSEISNNEATINTTSGSNAKEVYIKVSKGARIWGITTYYSSVQYSGYTTKVSEPSTPATHTLTLVAKDNDTYYATFSNNEPVLFPTDVEVDAVSVTGNTMHITAMESTKGTYNVKTDVEGSSASVGNLYYVPANTGVLIQSRTNTVTYYYPYEEATVTLPANQLKPAPAGGGTFAPEAGHVYYKLAYNNYDEKTGLGFYWGAENGGAFSVKAGTAYLAVPTTEGSGAKAFTLDGGVVTGISSVNVESNRTKTIYNIAGQRVYDMTKSGLYIVDGKKVVVK